MMRGHSDNFLRLEGLLADATLDSVGLKDVAERKW